MSLRNNFFACLAAILIAFAFVIFPTQTVFANEESDKHNGQGVSYFNSGDWEKAVEEFKAAIDIEEQPLYYFNLGNSYYRWSKYKEAEENLTSAVNKGYNEASVYYLRGMTYYELGKHEDAIKDLNEAINRKPDWSSDFHFGGLAKVYLAQGKKDEAKQYFIESAKKLSNAGSYEAAINDLNDAINLDGNNLEAHNLRGRAYFYSEKYDAALKDFNKVIQIDSKYADAYRWSGFVYWKQGKIEEAKRNFMISGETLHLSNREYDEAETDFNSALELDPNYGEAYFYLGQIEKWRGSNHPAAIEKYTKAIELGFKEDYVYNNRGHSKYILKEYKEAIKDFDEAVKIDPTFAEPYKWRGECYFELSNFDNACADWEKFITLETDEKTKKEYEEKLLKIKPAPGPLDDLKESLNEFKTVVKENRLLQALLLVMTLEYFLSLGCSRRNGTLTAGVAARNFGIKIILLLIVFVVSALDESEVSIGVNLLTITMAIILVNELMSILDKAERLGMPVPDWLKNLVEYIRGVVDRIFGGSDSSNR